MTVNQRLTVKLQMAEKKILNKINPVEDTIIVVDHPWDLNSSTNYITN